MSTAAPRSWGPSATGRPQGGEGPLDVQDFVTKRPEVPTQAPAAGGAARSRPPRGREEPEEPAPSLEELLAELDGLCGLDKVKADVKSLINLVKVRRLRQEHDLPVPPCPCTWSLWAIRHRQDHRSPAAGQDLPRHQGCSPRASWWRWDRSGLVAGFVEQTAIKTGEVIQKALGGVLFIDEAYALANHDNANDFGQEAIETLLKGMEDHRADLIVIVAGYTELMGNFIHSNPGLESRFNKYFYFEDYTPRALMEIFRSMCQKNGYTLDGEAEARAAALFQALYEERDENFGNARDVRNLFERAVARQANSGGRPGGPGQGRDHGPFRRRFGGG